MIDRKATLVCAALVVLMLVEAVGHLLTQPDWTSVPALVLFAFPTASALVVAALYWSGRGSADETKIAPWRQWGTSLAIVYCVGMLLMQSLATVRSLGLPLDLPVDLTALARAGGLVLSLVSLLAINKMPKLPWFERVAGPGGELGPIYGPRYVRMVSRVLVVFMIAVITWSQSVTQPTPWQSAGYILAATALLVVWSLALRRHLSRKWQLERRRGAA
jgi:hypothetical protein